MTLPVGRFGCVYPDCTERFKTVGEKKRHIRTAHPDDSPCAEPNEGDGT